VAVHWCVYTFAAATCAGQDLVTPYLYIYVYPGHLPGGRFHRDVRFAVGVAALPQRTLAATSLPLRGPCVDTCGADFGSKNQAINEHSNNKSTSGASGRTPI